MAIVRRQREGLERFDPWRELDEAWRRMERLFSEFFGGGPLLPERTYGPALDVYETEDAVVVEAEVPGMEAKDLEIELADRRLRLSGEARREEEKEGKGYYRKERYFGRIYREVELPADVDPERARAELKNGILTLTLPKVETAKARKIKIT
jgi:HSP20 family protein